MRAALTGSVPQIAIPDQIVILSVARSSQRELLAESKDPYSAKAGGCHFCLCESSHALAYFHET
jgi:hypothetical protein